MLKLAFISLYYFVGITCGLFGSAQAMVFEEQLDQNDALVEAAALGDANKVIAHLGNEGITLQGIDGALFQAASQGHLAVVQPLFNRATERGVDVALGIALEHWTSISRNKDDTRSIIVTLLSRASDEFMTRAHFRAVWGGLISLGELFDEEEEKRKSVLKQEGNIDPSLHN